MDLGVCFVRFEGIGIGRTETGPGVGLSGSGNEVRGPLKSICSSGYDSPSASLRYRQSDSFVDFHKAFVIAILVRVNFCFTI